MKSLLSDRGTEWNNVIVQTLLKNLGIEHLTTSSFNPRTNGQCEVLNFNIINSLRKHAESDRNFLA